MSICPIRIFSHARFARFRYCCQGAVGRASARARSSKSRGAPFPFYLQTWCRSVIHLLNVSRFSLHIWNQFIFLPTVYLDRICSCRVKANSMRRKLKELQEANEANEANEAKEVEQAWVIHESFRGTFAEIVHFPGIFSNFQISTLYRMG